MSDIGQYGELAEGILAESPFSLSYLARDWPEVEVWRAMARAKVHELLAFWPDPVAFDARTEPLGMFDGVQIERVSYAMPYGGRLEALMLLPEGAKTPLPAVMALHDHGGYKYLGKEKIISLPDQPESITAHQESAYGGRGWADALCRRGYAVFVPDVFAFGSRRIKIGALTPDYRQMMLERFPGLEKVGSTDPADYETACAAYNEFAAYHESILAKTLFTAGTTWPGVFAYEDRRSLDYLMTRPEIDPECVGCGGLSGGGLRTVLLSGLDSRIKCAVTVGFMNSFAEFVPTRMRHHTWMMYIPHLPRYMDWPDLNALRAPAPLMVQYDEEDQLFTFKGQREADSRIRAVYRKMGAAQNYSGRFYPGPHKFDVSMQEDAFDWFDKWLK
jgi:dienelactone hydrolase